MAIGRLVNSVPKQEAQALRRSKKRAPQRGALVGDEMRVAVVEHEVVDERYLLSQGGDLHPSNSGRSWLRPGCE